MALLRARIQSCLSVAAVLVALGAVVVVNAASANGQARAASRTLPAPKVTVYPGDVIDDALVADVVFTERSVRRLHVFQSRTEVVGMEARRTLVAGQPIPINALRKPETVTQGKRYPIVFEQDGLVITGAGIALQSGSPGDSIALRNADSGTTITGTIRPDGTVRVGLR